MTRAPAEACLVNLRSAGIAKRRRAAVVLLVLAVVALAALSVLDLPHRWRALLVFPFWMSALCWLQAAAKT